MPFKQTTSDLQLWTQHLKKNIYKNKLPFVENIVYRQKIMVKENSPYIHKCSYLPQNKSSFQTLNIQRQTSNVLAENKHTQYMKAKSCETLDMYQHKLNLR